MISGDADNIQIMGGADGVEIMGADAAPASAKPPVPPALIVMPMHRPISTMEKVGVAGAVLLLVGGVVYALKKK